MKGITTTIATAAVLALLAPAAALAGSGKLYWSNFGSTGQIYSAKIGGGGVKEFAPPGATIEDPAGLAADMTRNRLYWTDWSDDKIHWASFDGSKSGKFNNMGLPLNDPTGLQIDQRANRIYWSNFSDDSLIWTRLQGGGGGAILPTGATTNLVAGIAIDRKANRIFWINFTTPGSVGSAKLDGTGGGFDLDLSGASQLGRAAGVALNKGRSRAYIGNNSGTISFAKTNGAAGSGDLNIAGVTDPNPHGVAIDIDRNRIHWVNSGSFGGATALAFADLGGSGGSNFNTGAVGSSDGAFPVILKKPRITKRPKVKQVSQNKLRCKRKRIAPDLPGSHLYRTAKNSRYRWERNGNVVNGEKKGTLKTGGKSGSYRCTLIAKNFFGKASRRSGSLKV